MYQPLALVLSPVSRSVPWIRDLLLVLAGSGLVALTAQVEIPLPFTPVPVTGQTFGVLLVGAALGWKRGALALATYYLEGLAGLPVFAGGAFGWVTVAGPTGGYLLGFIPAAALVGYLAERGYDRKWWTALPAFLGGQSVIFLVGVPWLAVFVGKDLALQAGLYPFILGGVMKTLLASFALSSAWKTVRNWDQKS